MESKILNFVDAAKLATILRANKKACDLLLEGDISNSLKFFSPQGYLEMLILFSGQTVEIVGRMSGMDALDLVISGVALNKVRELLQSYKDLG